MVEASSPTGVPSSASLGAELGAIAGAGLSGFCFGVIIGGLAVDKLGCGRLVVVAFVFHVLSAFVTFGGIARTGEGGCLRFPLLGIPVAGTRGI